MFSDNYDYCVAILQFNVIIREYLLFWYLLILLVTILPIYTLLLVVLYQDYRL